MEHLQELRHATTPSRPSARWAARTPPSSARRPTSTRPPTACCARRSASAARSARPLPRLRRAPGLDDSSTELVEQARGLTGRRSARRATVHRAGDQREGGRRATRTRSREAHARRRGRRSAASASTDGDLGRGYFVAPTIVDRPAARHRLWQRRAVRALRGRRAGRLARRGARRSPTTPSTASPRGSTARTRPRSTSS